MKKILIFISSFLLITQLKATDSFNSEFSHAVGGVVTAGGIVAVVDGFYPEYREDRAMIGFVGSSIIVVIQQAIDYAEYRNAKGQLLDAGWHIVGSALGAYVTDQYILSPVVKESSTEGKYVGFLFQHSF
ncbi:hypothetical protein [Sulfurimonas marina]|uniref:DUF2279 domain-containing protein n=1 Tax=Sulfurimonas marina TaxID=2590551 RepID=A0A7M1AU28_9BACT|nr:hypothetical protein [Sulfurimonas marina]QOP40900.1 hypothetical protein FJR03_03760 [Sulfurimonas marina]